MHFFATYPHGTSIRPALKRQIAKERLLATRNPVHYISGRSPPVGQLQNARRPHPELDHARDEGALMIEEVAATMDAQLTTKQGHVLFYKLCMDLGLCLRQDHVAKLLEHPPADVYSFTNAIFHAERLDPETTDRDLWNRVRQYVAAAFETQPQAAEPPESRYEPRASN